MRHWTEEARKAQAEAIKRWQPWTKSTGPRTAAGKARCARNAECRDGSVQGMALIISALRRQKAFVIAQKNRQKQTIMTGLKPFDFKAYHEAFMVEMISGLQLMGEKFQPRPQIPALPPCDILRVA